ncbi:bifunctional 3'-5' exonuclease/DNA polymerase [Glutamicibacter endophyticus]|uniref:bifunctional 3'-5' exonuclease/DNA polymerase n=1 Tax=Glutamicibacter endophyticus TaxID=1522174 RepID=UPI003AEF83D8
MSARKNSVLAFLATTTEGTPCLELRDEHSAEPLAARQLIAEDQLAQTVAQVEREYRPRWVIVRASRWIPQLLDAGVRLSTAYVLDLAARILHRSPFASAEIPDAPADLPRPAAEAHNLQDALFAEPASAEETMEYLLQGYREQRAAMPHDQLRAQRLRILLNAESTGALIACEMEQAGLPWDERAHRALLREQLGERVPEGVRPPRLATLAEELGRELQSPGLNPDSPQELLRALHRRGINVASVRAWELERVGGPVVEKILHYKKLARLASAHGDQWLDAWVQDGRFHPHYVLGTVASGRWAAAGGGALQLPHSIRSVVRAGAGRVLVVADGRQLEPRILAAISHDERLLAAGEQDDLYQWLIDQRLVPDRQQAKLGMLSVIYGGGGGGSGQVLAALRAGFPKAMAFVDAAAEAGERGEGVHSFLGRGCPPADADWLRAQRGTSDAAGQAAADAAARARGRFTRNFVVQATAAEWALAFMGHARHLVHSAGWDQQVRQVFFVHDEVVFDAPQELATQLGQLLRHAAVLAGRSLFGDSSPNFPLSIAAVQSYAEAK